MRRDDGGEFWITAMLIGAAVGVVAQYVSDVVWNLQEGKVGQDAFEPRSSIVDYVAAGVGGAIAAIPGTNLISALVTGAAGNIATGLIKGDISNAYDVLESGISGAVANGLGYGLSKILSKLKVNQISSMSRTGQKDFLTSKVYKNSRSYANANLHTFMDNPLGTIENTFSVFKYGVYSTFTSTTILTIYGGIGW